MKDFLKSLMQRKVIFVIYTILEKWILLSKCIEFNKGLLILIFGKDIVVLTALGIISFEKIKLSYNKN